MNFYSFGLFDLRVVISFLTIVFRLYVSSYFKVEILKVFFSIKFFEFVILEYCD